MALAISMALAVYCLERSIYFGRAASGSQTAYPAWWQFQSDAYLTYSIASLIFGLCAIIAIPKWPKVGRLPMLLFVITIGITAIPYMKEFVKIDSCLDGGGRWNENWQECEN